MRQISKELKNQRLGETRMMNCGMKATIIKYNGTKDIDIEFEDGAIISKKQYDSFIKGNIRNPNIYNYTISFNNLINKKFGKLYVISINEDISKKKKRTYYNCKCDCGNSCVIQGSSLTGTKGTKSCGCLNRQLARERVLNRSKNSKTLIEYNNNSINYVLNEEDLLLSYGSNKKIICECPICKNKKNYTVNQIANNMFSCEVCGDKISKGEKYVYQLLKQLEIDFERQIKFDWSNNKIYDFYIKEKSLIIEVNGSQHYKDSHFGKYEDIHSNDLYKRKLAIDNGIKYYIEIDYSKENLKYLKENIIKTDMNILFDLSNIDWVKCEEYCFNGNILNKVCSLYLSGKTVKEIKKELKLGETLIRRLLKLGNNLNICKYGYNKED